MIAKVVWVYVQGAPTGSTPAPLYLPDISPYPYPAAVNNALESAMYQYPDAVDVVGGEAENLWQNPDGTFGSDAEVGMLNILPGPGIILAATRTISMPSYPPPTYGYGAFVQTKIKVFGPTWGVLCQYATQDYQAYYFGTPAGMKAITPGSHSIVNCADGGSFEFTPTDVPADSNVYEAEDFAEPATAIYWPGSKVSDFPWGG